MKLMKNLTAIALAAVMTTALVGCGAASGSTAASSTPAGSSAASTADAAYTIKNTTGMKVTELYLYEADAEEKGANHAGEGLEADAVVEITTPYSEEASAATYVLEFVTEDGAAQKFGTLYFEVAAIDLLSVDAAAGATPIVFGY